MVDLRLAVVLCGTVCCAVWAVGLLLELLRLVAVLVAGFG